MKLRPWKVTPSPFILTRPSVSTISLIFIASLLPHLGMIVATGDLRALANLATALGAAMLADLITCSLRSAPFPRDGSALVAGLVTGLLMPITIHPLLAGVFAFMGICTAKSLFGGTGSYWISPGAIALAFAYISLPSAFPQTLVTPDGISTVGNAFGALKLEGFTLAPQDISLTGSLNNLFAGTFGIKIPEGYVTLFWNNPSVIPAFRYNILTLGASILLLASKSIDWIAPLCFLLVYSLLVRYLSLSSLVPGEARGDILFALLTGGMLFHVFYLLTDYSLLPRTSIGKAIIGILGGCFAFLLCGPGGTPMGGIFSILLMNALAPLIELGENKRLAALGRESL
jgi:electron transport complex protein RnfD